MLYSLVTASIKLEIEEYKKTQKWQVDGYLNKLYAYSAISWFVELIEKNPEVNAFQAYMAILIDAKNNDRKIFNNKESIVDKTLFYKNVVRLSAGVLATSAITSKIITNLYWEYNRKVFPHLRSLSKSLKHNLSRGWKAIKNIIPSTLRGWTFNVSPTFTIRKWHVTGIFYNIDRGVDFLRNAAPILGAAMLAFEVFLLVYDLLKVETIQNFYVYTAPDGTEFIWNGGKTVSRFFGMDVKEVNGISSMQLVEPIQITLPQIEEYYYFNGLKYYDPNQGKKAYLQYLFYGNISYNKQFNCKYVFDDEKNIINSNIFNSIDELKDSIFSSLNIDRNKENIDINKLNVNSKYVSKIGYRYNNISSFNPTKLSEITKTKFINDIISNIREIYFVKLPQFFEKDDSILIPGKVWKNGIIIENNTSKLNEYLLSNKANEVNDKNEYLISNKQDAKNLAREELKSIFMKSTNVLSKEIIATNSFSSIIQKNTFDNVDKDIKTQKVYIVNKLGKGVYKFLDKSKAEKFAMEYKSIKKNFILKTQIYYIYNDMYFKDENELKEWIISNKSF